MEILKYLFDFILHIDVHLAQIIATYGTLTYAILFGIIFMETGLVFTPFLPGDSLLFAAGALAALGNLNIFALVGLLFCAALIGDTTNYWIGHFFGRKIVAHPIIPINEEHIKKTELFFKKYGGKTIIMARFMPIIRTFTPFVAGVGKMGYKRFISFSVFAAALWVSIATFSGYYFGNIPFVRKNFSFVILVVILISLLPIFIEVIKKKLKKKRE
ncbi:MAG: DedA family protein [bacterium]